MRRRELPGGIPPPTKSELKRQAQEVQDLADRLVGAPEGLLEALDLPDKLVDAIALARRIPGGGALVRQRQFVAKLMRGLPLGPIRDAVDAAADGARLDAARFRRAERWRDRLLAGGDAALAEFLAEFPADAAETRERVAAALAERRGGAAAGAGRRLFRHVKGLVDLPPEPR